MITKLSPSQASPAVTASDPELVARAQAGEKDAFEELVRRHREKVYRFALRLCYGHAADADETYQNALLNAYRHLADFRGEAQFSSWLVRIVINECLQYRRRYAREPERVHLAEETSAEQGFPARISSASSSPEEECARREFVAIWKQCVAKLSEPQRMILSLHYIEGLSYRDVALRMGCSTSAVRNRLFRARRSLKHFLEDVFCGRQKCYWPAGFLACTRQGDRKKKEQPRARSAKIASHRDI